MKKIVVLLSAFLVVYLVSCTGKMNLKNQKDATISANGIEMQGIWLKDKDDKFDMGISISNKTSKPIIINRGSVACGRNNITGSLHYTSIDITGQQWNFEPDEKKEFYIICKLPQILRSGSFSVKLRQAYNTTEEGLIDRKKPILDKNLVLTINK